MPATTPGFVTSVSRPALTSASISSDGREITASVKSSGNPFLIKETARLLDSEGALAATTEVPAGAREVLQRRIARLPATAQTILRQAAVIGTETDADLLADVAGVEDHVLLDAVEAGLSFRHDGPEKRQRIAAEVLALPGKPVTADAVAHLLAMAVSSGTADFGAADRHADQAARIATRYDLLTITPGVTMYRAMRTVLDGRSRVDTGHPLARCPDPRRPRSLSRHPRGGRPLPACARDSRSGERQAVARSRDQAAGRTRELTFADAAACQRLLLPLRRVQLAGACSYCPWPPTLDRRKLAASLPQASAVAGNVRPLCVRAGAGDSGRGSGSDGG